MYYKSNRLAAPLSSLEDQELLAVNLNVSRLLLLVGSNEHSLATSVISRRVRSLGVKHPFVLRHTMWVGTKELNLVRHGWTLLPALVLIHIGLGCVNNLNLVDSSEL